MSLQSQPGASKDYVGIARQYCSDVIDGTVPACKWVQLACKRQVTDMLRADLHWHFSDSHASRVCRFIEKLPHIKGKFATRRELIKLEPWQIFILTTIFGWVDDHGNRRFLTAYLEIPRKNAKSTLVAGMALYCTFAEGEAGAEGYSAATTAEQAAVIFKTAKAMVDKTPALRTALGITSGTHSLYCAATTTLFRALSRENGGNHDGLNIHFAGIDELHSHKTSEMLDVIQSGTGSREQSLVVAITTAGTNPTGVCYDQHLYVEAILKDAAPDLDDRYFGIIYTIDVDDDISDPLTWQKANPNYGISVEPDKVAAAYKRGTKLSREKANFLTKYLNVWVRGGVNWMDMAAWDAVADPELNEADFSTDRCWNGLDLASQIDIASFMRVYERIDADGLPNYYVFGTQYINETATSTNDQYAAWAEDGYLVETLGAVTDFHVIEDDIRVYGAKTNLQEVAFDPWQATYMNQQLQDSQIPMVELRNNVASMSEPMKMLEVLIKTKRIHHTGDPVLRWMASNILVEEDRKGNIYPRKARKEDKIDGIVALIYALNRALLHVPSVNDSEAMDDYLNDMVIVSKR
jgi:phage terminase large subunit-like protein